MADNGMDRRRFLDFCARAGALAVVPGIAGGRMIDALGAATRTVGSVSSYPAKYWESLDGGTVRCKLCPRACETKLGARGTCGVRENSGGKLVSKVYGRPAMVRDDAIEKAPLFHYLPATRTLSLGTAGCNLDCGYCQNWEFARALPEDTDNKNLPPDSLVSQVKQAGGKSILFTYSEGVVSIEYLLETARLAKQAGLHTLLKTAGYVCPEPLADILAAVDAINIDLKAYSHEVYRTMTTAELDPVLDTIKAAAASNVWLEIANLVVPGYNDNDAMVRRMAEWIIANCGANTPLHMSRFFPQYRFRHIEPTPKDTLLRLRKVAYNAGMKYVYLGNMGGDPAESTYCPKCWMKVIERVGYRVSNKGLDLNTSTCVKCGYKIPGIWV